MLNIFGFRLIKINNNTTNTYVVEYASISHQTNIKYKIEKVNAFDPTIIIKRGAYNDDLIEIEAILNRNEFNNLSSFLTSFDKLFIEFDANNETLQFPVIVEKFPKLEDRTRFKKSTVKFSLKSTYKTLEPVNFNNLFGYGLKYGENWGF